MIGDLFRFSWHLLIEAVWSGVLVLLWVWLIDSVEKWYPKLEDHPWITLAITGIPVFILGPSITLTFIWICFFIGFTRVEDARDTLVKHFKWMTPHQAKWLFIILLCCVFLEVRQYIR